VRISPDIARPIVSKVMAIFPYNINIMDAEGVIIASGDPDRVGSYHAGAVKVLRSRSPLEIFAKDMRDLEGVRPGVNLPIEFRGEVTGVVGITGDPETIRDYGFLVKTMVEMSMEQTFLVEQFRLEERTREGFLHNLLFGWHDVALLQKRAEMLGYDLTKQRIALVAQISGCPDSSKMVEQEHIRLQAVKDETSRIIQQAVSGRDSIITGQVGGDYVAVLLPFEGKPADANPVNTRSYRRVIETAQRILNVTQRTLGVEVSIGIAEVPSGIYTTDAASGAREGEHIDGGPMENAIRGLAVSFNQALQALEIGQRLSRKHGIFLFADLKLARLVAELPRQSQRLLMTNTLGPLLESCSTKSSRGGGRLRDGAELLRTLQEFLDHGGDSKPTAEALFIHRNTLSYRLDQIKELTGLNPRLLNDAVLFRVALLSRELQGLPLSAGEKIRGHSAMEAE
jgi:carbohydrate diacid regulator